ncbi:hypothetical protein Hypma_004219 [Hypsizygus marmoreus]|uniref:Protein kinase domain-containing protein n=1 Tax=Hypsizygus marmoreus TaxID=39966 RepID=A0A369J240_HYPMA|nr:hypothetical protein Hypma_004219 [Hypsizygus marmoreus]
MVVNAKDTSNTSKERLPNLLNTDMTSVSSVTVQGLASSDSGPTDITLLRARSFPACRYSDVIRKVPPIPGWASATPPKGGCNIKLQLGERISVGRVGLVYNVDVLDITHPTTNSPPHLDLPPQLCIKVVKERHARSLAREAWFYEQLAHAESLAGVVTPRCFGFFLAELKKCFDAAGNPVTRVEPWAQCKPEEPWPNDTRLPDDVVDIHFRDEGGARKKSRWNRWEASPSDPLVCLLLLEKLGASCNDDKDEYMQDIHNMVYDLGYAGIVQGDVRYPNVLRAPVNDNSPLCPRHHRRHEWRLIDFDRAFKMHLTAAVPFDEELATLYQATHVGGPYFWDCL